MTKLFISLVTADGEWFVDIDERGCIINRCKKTAETYPKMYTDLCKLVGREQPHTWEAFSGADLVAKTQKALKMWSFSEPRQHEYLMTVIEKLMADGLDQDWPEKASMAEAVYFARQAGYDTYSALGRPFYDAGWGVAFSFDLLYVLWALRNREEGIPPELLVEFFPGVGVTERSIIEQPAEDEADEFTMSRCIIDEMTCIEQLVAIARTCLEEMQKEDKRGK